MGICEVVTKHTSRIGRKDRGGRILVDPTAHGRRHQHERSARRSSARGVVGVAEATQTKSLTERPAERVLATAPAGRGDLPDRADRDGTITIAAHVGARPHLHDAGGRALSRPELDDRLDRDGELKIEAHVRSGRRGSDLVAHVPDTVTVVVRLIRVGVQRAVVFVVVHTVVVRVAHAHEALIDLPRAVVVLLVADLHAPVGRNTVESVTGVTQAVTIGILLPQIGHQRAIVADVAEAVRVRIGLLGVGGVAAVVEAVVHAIEVRVATVGISPVGVAVEVAVDVVGAESLGRVGPLVVVAVLVGHADPPERMAPEPIEGPEAVRPEVRAVAEVLATDVVGQIARD